MVKKIISEEEKKRKEIIRDFLKKEKIKTPEDLNREHPTSKIIGNYYLIL